MSAREAGRRSTSHDSRELRRPAFFSTVYILPFFGSFFRRFVAVFSVLAPGLLHHKTRGTAIAQRSKTAEKRVVAADLFSMDRYIGHRYVELHGFPGIPTADNLQQRVVHSDVEPAPAAPGQQTVPRRLAGSIAFPDRLDSASAAPAIDGPRCYNGAGCSAPRPSNATAPAVLDQISHNVRWGLIDNLHSVPEDCDQRNERWGWMGDGSVSAEGNFQYHWMPALYSGWLNSMRDVQTEPNPDCSAATGVDGDTNIVNGKANCSGAVAEIVPGSTPVAIPGDPSWMFAYRKMPILSRFVALSVPLILTVSPLQRSSSRTSTATSQTQGSQRICTQVSRRLPTILRAWLMRARAGS